MWTDGRKFNALIMCPTDYLNDILNIYCIKIYVCWLSQFNKYLRFQILVKEFFAGSIHF
jgi:hypothetical protein